VLRPSINRIPNNAAKAAQFGHGGFVAVAQRGLCGFLNPLRTMRLVLVIFARGSAASLQDEATGSGSRGVRQ
jgi:hypothetical protein